VFAESRHHATAFWRQPSQFAAIATVLAFTSGCVTSHTPPASRTTTRRSGTVVRVERWATLQVTRLDSCGLPPDQGDGRDIVIVMYRTVVGYRNRAVLAPLDQSPELGAHVLVPERACDTPLLTAAPPPR